MSWKGAVHAHKCFCNMRLPSKRKSLKKHHTCGTSWKATGQCFFFFFFLIFIIYLGFPGGSVVKNLSMQETGVWSLGWEDPLEKEMATCFSSLASKMPWTEEHGGLQSMGSQSVGHDWAPEHIYLFGCVRSQLRHLGIFAACGIIRCHIQTLSNCSTRA